MESGEKKTMIHSFWQAAPYLRVCIWVEYPDCVNYYYVRLLIRLQFGLTDSAAPPSVKSCPYMLLTLLFLLNNRLEVWSTEANISSNSINIVGQLSFKCKKASDCITAAQNIIINQSIQKLKFQWFKKAKEQGLNSCKRQAKFKFSHKNL